MDLNELVGGFHRYLDGNAEITDKTKIKDISPIELIYIQGEADKQLHVKIRGEDSPRVFALPECIINDMGDGKTCVRSPMTGELMVLSPKMTSY